MKKRILSCLMALALCLTLLPATAQAEDGHASHPICGQTCSHNTGEGMSHPDETFKDATWLASQNGALCVRTSSTSSSSTLLPEEGNYVILKDGYYYLSTTADNCDQSYVKSYKTIKIQGNVTICLNGNQIQKAGNTTGPVFEVPSDCTLTLTNCKGTGQIVCNDDSNGSGVYVNGGTLNLYSGQITRSYGQKGTDSNKYGGGVYVGAGGTFNMYGGVITENSANYGGGVYVKSGTFNMDGGTIKSNTSSGGYGTLSFGGAGVYVEASGNFIMNNTASVTENKIGYGSTGGAGVYVNGGTFEMHNDASVADNTVNNINGSSGGGVYVHGGTFEMHNSASVTGNKATNGTLNGGGVYVNGSGTFAMNNSASVSGNTANQGGGVYVESGTFNMNDGKISGNKAKNDKASNDTNGGGVYVKSGTFNMNDGTIGGATAAAANTATNGGGVYVLNGTFNMNGNVNGNASITSNKAKQDGGGVCVSHGDFIMSGGSITGNDGNGVYVLDATFTVSGAPTVTGNTREGAASNVYLTGSEIYITIGGKLTGDKGSIGVTKRSNSVIAKGVNEDYSGKFFSDDNTYEVKHENNQLVLKNKETQPPTHEHKWTYTIKEGTKNTIVATCANTDQLCNNRNGGSVTIEAPTDLTYDGNAKTAEVIEKNWKGSAVSEITYYRFAADGSGNHTEMSGVPKDVGKYKAEITVKGATAFVEYEITDGSTPAKREQEPLHLASDKNTLAVGETLTLTATGGSGSGEVSCHVTGGTGDAKIKGNVLTAEKAGTVMVTAVKEGDTEFAEAKSEPLTITITEKSGGGTTGGNTGGSTGGTTGGSSGSSSGGSSSSDRDSSDSNPVVKTETKNNADGSTTKTETRKDGSVTATTTGKDGGVSKTETKKDGSSVTENKAADGSTGTVKTDKNGQTTAKTALSNKAIEDAKKNGEAVKAPVEVEATKDSSTAPTVKVELPKNSGETKVEIPVSNVKPGTVAVLVHPDGTEEIVKNSIPTENGIRLTVDGSATVKIIDNSKDFIDTRNHWAREEIDFVSARELVNGMSDSIYAPNNSTTRAQLWTILARQNDADLNGGNTWYEKAQLWSKNKGISDGTEPNAAINRAQMVTMLWRTMGQPAAGGAANFTDVPAGSYYAQAVAWAVESGITAGVGGGRFDPSATCTRAQIAAFLARSMK